jgi:uncharacterized OsmC-like protein
VFTELRIHHALTGVDIDDQSVAEAIDLSESKYCSVGAMLRARGAHVKTTYSISSTTQPPEKAKPELVLA